MSLSLKCVEQNEVSILLNLIRELAAFEHLEHEVVATEQSLSESIFEQKTAKAWLIYRNDKLAGYTLAFHSFSTFMGRKGLYIEDVYVRPEFRHQGIGRAIFNAMAQYAVATQCGRMEWNCLNWNQNAYDFYLKIGAKPLNEWTYFRVECDAILNLANAQTPLSISLS